MSEEAKQRVLFLDDFIQKNTFNTPGHLSECRSRWANNTIVHEKVCMCKYSDIVVKVRKISWRIINLQDLTREQLHVRFNK